VSCEPTENAFPLLLFTGCYLAMTTVYQLAHSNCSLLNSVTVAAQQWVYIA
jgi:hypothetical protein